MSRQTYRQGYPQVSWESVETLLQPAFSLFEALLSEPLWLSDLYHFLSDWFVSPALRKE